MNDTQQTAANDQTAKTTERATFGAGCFWGVEAEFRQVEGVVATVVGYEGGRTSNPTYRDVCSHTTGHAEVVEVDYDPRRVSYDQLLDVFWENHDPTQLNRQGPDVGDQYRSVIFFHTPEQAAAAKASLERQTQSGHYRRPIVTQIVPAETFNRAEDYHQQYLEKRGLATCRI
ncbi:MAG: peptide-methionine (S)-S-oxide reductase MsrA [Ktedonobacterales bacterium]